VRYSNIVDGFTDLSGIPIIIPTFNNPTYLKNMVDFLFYKNNRNIIVVDNNSTYPYMLDYLEDISNDIGVVRQYINAGPRQFFNDPEAFALLPEYFIVTDPDLELRQELPENFIEIFKNILDKHNVFKVGCALDIELDNENVLDELYVVGGGNTTIRQIESNYYLNRDTQYEDLYVYHAPVDTTFALYKKSNAHFGFFSGMRVGGDFTAHHFGWDVKLPMPDNEYNYYKNSVRGDFSSTEVLKRDGRI
jgi:hypothetical protein